MESIEHQGIIESMTDHSMRIRIEQTSACSGCQAKKMCSSADKQDKWVDVTSFSGSWEIGQMVIVAGKSSTGLKAVALAYVFPLILMMLGLVVSALWLFPGKDGIAALVALSVTFLYYLMLYPFRKILQGQFVFTVRPFTEDPSAGAEAF